MSDFATDPSEPEDESPNASERLTDVVVGIPARMGAWVGRQLTLLLYLLPPIPCAALSYWLWRSCFPGQREEIAVGTITYLILVWASFGAGPPTADGILSHILTIGGLYLSLLLPVAATGSAVILWRGWPHTEACWAMAGVGVVALGIAFCFWDTTAPIADIEVPSLLGTGTPTIHLRGPLLGTMEEAADRTDAMRSLTDKGLFFGGVRLPFSSSTLHFCFVGATGSGKTLSLLLLLKDALAPIGVRRGHNALVFDGKNELTPYIFTMAPASEIHLLNPADRRSSRWAVHRDIRSDAQALQFAGILFPDDASVKASGGDPHHDEFFRHAPRDVLVGVLMALIERRRTWDLRDLVLILRDEERIKEVLSFTASGRRRLQYFHNDQRSGYDILATLRAKVADLAIVAAWWQHTTEEVSLRDWVRSSSILILGTDAESSVGVEAINRLMFKTASDLLLAQSNSTQRRHWMILDEAREAGSLDIRSLALKGRSKGISIAYTLQDRDGMISLYKREGADEILGQYRNKAILALSSPESQKWASDVFGVQEELLFLHTRSVGSASTRGASHTYGTGLTGGPPPSTTDSHSTTSNHSSGTNETFQSRPIVLASEFGDIGITTPETGLRGYYTSPVAGTFTNTLSGEFLRDNLPLPAPDVPEFVRRGEEEGRLAEWTHADYERLGLRPDLEADAGSNRNDGDGSRTARKREGTREQRQ